MTRPILVTGGSGTLGRALVPRLLDLGGPVRVLSRRGDRPGPGAWVTGDLVTGAGLDRALDGVATVVHCASDPRDRRVDVDGTARLIEEARRAGAPHLVHVSIVGIDRVPLPYYAAKLEAERLVEASGLPWTILRCTQFHDLLVTLLARRSRLPVLVVPAFTRFQPIDVGDVADRLVELVRAGRPAGRTPDLGGPRVCAAAELVRTYLRITGRRALVLPVPLPGPAGRAMRRGGLLAPDHAEGTRTWEEFLAGLT